MPDESPRRSFFLDLTPLRASPAYRRFWISGVAGGIGVQLTAVAIGIHVYEISGSTAAVALVGGLALAPMLAMGLIGGAIVDAFDRRRVLIVASLLSFIAPIGIAALAWADVTALWPYYAFTTLSSTMGSLVGAARFAIHPRLVPRELLAPMAALSGLSAGLQAAAGPALAGVLVAAFGFAWTYTIDCALFLVGFWGIVTLPPIRPEGSTRPGPRGIVDGLRFLARSSNLRDAIGLQLVAFVCGRPYAILPAVGAVLIGGGAAVVGVLTSTAAIGVIASGIFSGRIVTWRRHGRAILGATGAFAILTGLVGGALLWLSIAERDHSPARPDLVGLTALAALLALVGAADNIAGIFRTTMMQAATPDIMRGRLQGLNTLVLTAGPRAGDLYAGMVAAGGLLWLPSALGAALLAITVILAVVLRPRFRTYDALEPTP